MVRRRSVERSPRAEAEQAAKRVRDLQQVTDVSLAQLPLDELLHELVVRISGVLDLDAAAIMLTDDDGATMTVRAAQGVATMRDGKPIRVAPGDGCAGGGRGAGPGGEAKSRSAWRRATAARAAWPPSGARYCSTTSRTAPTSTRS